MTQIILKRLDILYGRVIVAADAAHSFGATYKGQKSGSVADFTSFSFHAVKNLTTAEGGALTWRNVVGLDNEKLYKFLEEHGKLKEVKNLKKIVSMANISFAYQNTPKGLGDAILYAEDFVKEEPFAVLLGDDLVDIDVVPATKELIETYNETKSTVVGCKEIDEKDLYKFGVVKPKDKVAYPFFEIVDFVEKPKDISLAPSKVASLGRYILTKDIFPALKNTSKGVGGEIQLTDAIKSLIATKKVFVRLFTGKRYDIGDKFGYVEAIIDYALKRDDLKEKIISYMKEKIK